MRAREMHELAKVIKEELGDFAIALCCSCISRARTYSPVMR